MSRVGGRKSATAWIVEDQHLGAGRLVLRGSLTVLCVCAVLSSCSPGAVLRRSPGASDGRVYQFYYSSEHSQGPLPLAVVDFTGAAEIQFEPGMSGYYAKVRTGQSCTELEWDERPICLLVDPEMNLFVNELPPSKDLDERLFSVFGPLLGSDPREVDSHRIGQLWRESFGDPTSGDCRVRTFGYKTDNTSRSSPAFSVFFYGSYGAGMGGPGVSVPCEYFDSVYENGERWAVLNCPKGIYRFRWQSGILLVDMSDKGELLAMIVDTKGENLSFADAAKAGLLDGKQPVSPLLEVSGLRVEELAGKPRILLP